MIAASQRSGELHAGGSHARQHSTSRSATPPAAHHANVIRPVIFQYDWSGGKRAGHSLWQLETLHHQRGRILWSSIPSLG